MMTFKELFIEDLRENDKNKRLTLVLDTREEHIMMPEEHIAQYIHNFFSEELKGKFPWWEEEVKIIGWYFKERKSSEDEILTHFGESYNK